jgi:hypothetical protein
VLEAVGRTDEARAEYELALDRYVRKGLVPAVDRIRRRLTTIGS